MRALLVEDIGRTQAILASPYVAPHARVAGPWEARLQGVARVLALWCAVQRHAEGKLVVEMPQSALTPLLGPTPLAIVIELLRGRGDDAEGEQQSTQTAEAAIKQHQQGGRFVELEFLVVLVL